MTRPLPRSAPAEQGVSAEGVLSFLSAVDASGKHELHSLMLLRHGHVVAETWWAPYRPDGAQLLFSLSKSFTATAVGFLVADDGVSVDDRVVELFPDELPPVVDHNLAALRVEHLLSMTVGHPVDSTAAIAGDPDDWVRAFLAQPITVTPGAEFRYDSGASYLLSAIVQRKTGQRVTEYLRPRLFEPLGISSVTSHTCPRGIDTGGWGMSATTEDVAKFGQLYLQRGQWDGVQLLPAGWVEQATSAKIVQSADFLGPARADGADPNRPSDWHQGYGYQFWMCQPRNSFRGDGAYGQYCVVLPDQDAVLVITSKVMSMQDVLDLCWDHLLPALDGGGADGVGGDPSADARLAGVLASSSLALPDGAPSSPVAGKVSGTAYDVSPNELGVHRVVVTFDDDGASCTFAVTHDGGTAEIRCGAGSWAYTVTDLPGTPPDPSTLSRNTIPPSRTTTIAAAGAWLSGSTFQMLWRYVDTPHHDLVTCTFGDGLVTVEFLSSFVRDYWTVSAAPPAFRQDPRPLFRGTSRL